MIDKNAAIGTRVADVFTDELLIQKGLYLLALLLLQLGTGIFVGWSFHVWNQLEGGCIVIHDESIKSLSCLGSINHGIRNVRIARFDFSLAKLIGGQGRVIHENISA